MVKQPAAEFNRKDRKLLRHWAGIAWDRELGAELEELGAAIEKWKAGELSAHDVSAVIHQFHDGAARDLYRFYTHASPESAIAQAIVNGIIEASELPAELLATLAPLIELHMTLNLPEAAVQASLEPDPVETHAHHAADFTPLQGQYLAFIDSYERLSGVAPAEANIQKHFGVTPPTVHQMVLTLERRGFISRIPGQARSIRLLVQHDDLPQLGKRPPGSPRANRGRPIVSN